MAAPRRKRLRQPRCDSCRYDQCPAEYSLCKKTCKVRLDAPVRVSDPCKTQCGCAYFKFDTDKTKPCPFYEHK